MLQLSKVASFYCRKLYDLYKVMPSKNLRRIRLPKSAKEDLAWWGKFATWFNGKAAISNVMYPDEMISDSSMSGFGVYLSTDWLAGTWANVAELADSPSCNHIGSTPVYDETNLDNINVLELWSVLLGLHRWCKLFKNRSVKLLVDNTQVKHMLINGVSANATCRNWLQEIFWVCVVCIIHLVPEYIPTENNFVADALSRISSGRPKSWDMLLNKIKGFCTSQATKQTRKRHWLCYRRFCSKYGLTPIPCSVDQAADYVSFLANFMKLSSIVTYYQAVRHFHILFGLHVPPLNDPYLRVIIIGISNSPAGVTVPKDPLVQDI